MYSFRSRVRYSEVGNDKKLSLSSLINYFQDCSTFQSQDIGFGVRKLEQERRAWLLSSWQIVVDRYPDLFEEIEVCTWAYDFKGFYGMRNFCLKDREGVMLARANSVWIYMDRDSGRPARIPKEEAQAYAIEEKLPMDYAGRKLPMPEEMEKRPPLVILKHQIDTNNHVNNGQYVGMAADFLPEAYRIGMMRAEYKMSAKLGEVVVPYTKEQDGIYTVALCDEAGKPYAVVEFSPG